LLDNRNASYHRSQAVIDKQGDKVWL